MGRSGFHLHTHFYLQSWPSLIHHHTPSIHIYNSLTPRNEQKKTNDSQPKLKLIYHSSNYTIRQFYPYKITKSQSECQKKRTFYFPPFHSPPLPQLPTTYYWLPILISLHSLTSCFPCPFSQSIFFTHTTSIHPSPYDILIYLYISSPSSSFHSFPTPIEY